MVVTITPTITLEEMECCARAECVSAQEPEYYRGLYDAKSEALDIEMGI